MMRVAVHPPTVQQPVTGAGRFSRSWSGEEGPINEEHARVRETVGTAEGAVVEKLYEMGFCSGEVILAVGEEVGAVVAAMRGARAAVGMSGAARWPQCYAVVLEEGARVAGDVARGGVAEHTAVFGESLFRFLQLVPVVPTMVYLAPGAGGFRDVWRWLKELEGVLEAGTAVLVRQANEEGAAAALREWVDSGGFVAMGMFGDAMLLRAGERGRGVARGLPIETFAAMRAAVAGSSSLDHLRQATAAARTALLNDRLVSPTFGKRGWPYEREDGPVLPESLPDGSPWPKISIVTPSYNYGRFLEETILSVLHQGYPNVEHIVMDGGSTDETAEVLERYRSRLAVAVSEKDGGQSNAINKGFARATGEIFTWINADDLLSPGALHAMALAFWHSKADVVAGICEQYRDERLIEKHMTCCENGPLPLPELLDIEGSWIAGQFFMQPEVMFTRAMWEKAGGHVKEELFYSMDYEMWLRFAVAGAKLHVIGRPICRFRHHEEQKTAVAEKFLPELRRVRDQFVAEHHVVPANQRVEGALRLDLRVASINDLGFEFGGGIGQKRIVTATAAAGYEVFAFSATDARMSTVNASVEEIVETVAGVLPDVVLIGNVHGARLPPTLLEACAKRWTTGVVLHDLWAMTGRCAYNGGCEKYLTGCDETCPTAEEYPALARDQIFPSWESRYSLYMGPTPPLLLANSEWTAEFVRGALAARAGDGAATAQVFTLRYGVELELFRPMPRAFCRRAFNLPQDRFLVLVSASSLADPRKGVQLLVEALGRLQLPDVTVVCLGRADDALQGAIPGLRALGYVNDPQRLAMVYAAVDLFVGASLEEAFGQVFTEAAACGTPSIGFPVGGVPEAIADGVTGVLAPLANAEELAGAIYRLYSDSARRAAMGAWGRVFAENEWSPAMAYHSVHVALRKSGAAARLKFPPKIRFVPQPPVLPAPVNLALHSDAWQPISGFQPWEGPYPDAGLPRCRWMVGPVSRLRVEPARPGLHQLRITCTTFHPNAMLRVVQNGKLLAEVAVPMFIKGSSGKTFTCEVMLDAAPAPIELHHWPWAAEDSINGTSVLLFELTVSDGSRRALPILETAASNDYPSDRK